MHTRRVAACALLFLAASLAAPASSQTGFSRSCNIRQIGSTGKWALANVFGQTVNGIPINQLDAFTESETYSFESITTDYFSVGRYWLWSVSARYTIYPLGGYSVLVYAPSPWFPGSAMLTDRLWAFSTRSGSAIGDNVFVPVDASPRYGVVGGHAYWDSPHGMMHQLPNSSATDCNCYQWGLSYTFLGMPDFINIAASTLFGYAICQS